MSGRTKGGLDRERGYYGLPPLKTPQWDWKVSGYIVVAGAGGAAQALAWIGSAREPERFRPVRRNAGVLALAGCAVGAGLLIADLATPRRFYNMLRILRPTSPMSIGTYILGTLAATSAVAMTGETRAVRRRPALKAVTEAARAGAALSGAGAATYTASLMSATSNPHWAAAPRALGAQFAGSAIATGAAALALGERAGGRRETAARLEAVAGLATLAHLGAGEVARRRRHRSGAAEGAGRADRDGALAEAVLAGLVPLAAYGIDRASGGRAAPAAVAGSLAVLAGGWLLREHALRSGHRAARRPEAAFAFAAPRNLPPPGRRARLEAGR